VSGLNAPEARRLPRPSLARTSRIRAANLLGPSIVGSGADQECAS
jgi:hypothetical protein